MVDVFDELTIEDNKILKELDAVRNDHKKILDLFAKRVGLYKEQADKTHDPIIKAIIDAKKSVIMSDMGLLSTQYQMQENITKIMTRLESLEGKVSHILDQKSSK
jgi:hypothetical protein